jgi:TIR domain
LDWLLKNDCKGRSCSILFFLIFATQPAKQPAINPHNLALRNQVGSVSTSRAQIFVCYSHEDAKWFKRLQVHLKPLEQQDLIELWDYAKIAVGTKWKEELQTVIQSSTMALLIVSANFLASDFIANHELPELLLRAETKGVTIMPIVVTPCGFKDSEIGEFQSINPPSKALSTMRSSEQDEIFVKLVNAIRQKLIKGNAS